jgi:glucose-1-phosphate cytidylyltransferase
MPAASTHGGPAAERAGGPARMKVVILAGGFGTRLSEETDARPKPLVEVGGYPLLWHIMKHYASHGFDEFLVAAGYKSELIKRYFMEYSSLNGDLTIDIGKARIEARSEPAEEWLVHVIDTGDATGTGGRVGRLRAHLGDSTFMATYGDGVSNVDLAALLRFHRGHGRIATVTAVRPPARFGGLVFDGDLVSEFTEKPQIGEGWINGGFLVFEPALFDYIEGDATSLEADALERLAEDRQLAAYRHDDFWQCMDTLRDKRLLEALWESGEVPWKVW